MGGGFPETARGFLARSQSAVGRDSCYCCQGYHSRAWDLTPATWAVFPRLNVDFWRCVDLLVVGPLLATGAWGIRASIEGFPRYCATCECRLRKIEEIKRGNRFKNSTACTGR